MADINLMLGELMNNPLFWVLIVILIFFGAGLHFGWFGKMRRGERFKEEDLTDTLMKDLKPRMKTMGKKVKNTMLMQNVNSFGKVRRYTEGKVKYHVRAPVSGNPGNPKGNPGKEEYTELKVDEIDMVYFTVGGNQWLSWIPYIGKSYEPEYFVIRKLFVTHDPQSKVFDIDPNVHIYPYAKIWISDVKTQRYLTELEARRTQEFEAETNINTLKRWTFYNQPQSGRVVVMEREADIEQDKWESAKDRGSEL